MNNDARDKLVHMMSSYGVQICSTPKTCETFLKQECSNYPDELKVLTEALNEGVVERILQHPVGQPWDAFASEQTYSLVGIGMREDVASWVVEAWAMALGKHPSAPKLAENDRYSTYPPTKSPAPSFGKKVSGQALVALAGGAGAAAGVFFSIGTLLVMNKTIPSILPEGWGSKSAELRHILGLLIVMAGAATAGSVGAFLGWLLGRGEPSIAWKGAVRTGGATFLMAAVGCTFSLDLETLEILVSWQYKQMGFDLTVVPAGTMLAAAGAALSVAFKGTIR